MINIEQNKAIFLNTFVSSLENLKTNISQISVHNECHISSK